ncbi:Transposon Tf2-11 polyprotein [Nymphaea thermarum]|nr:Transposon Tf2-11 polyprotein [Nymphaea thermarum]
MTTDSHEKSEEAGGWVGEFGEAAMNSCYPLWILVSRRAVHRSKSWWGLCIAYLLQLRMYLSSSPCVSSLMVWDCTTSLMILWREYTRLAGTRVLFSSAHHPQTNRQTEVVNRTIKTYLWRFAGHRPSTWVKHLSWCERSCNTRPHLAISMSPYEVVYRCASLTLRKYKPGLAREEDLECALLDRDEVLRTLRMNLECAQHRMPQQHDKV